MIEFLGYGYEHFNKKKLVYMFILYDIGSYLYVSPTNHAFSRLSIDAENIVSANLSWVICLSVSCQ